MKISKADLVKLVIESNNQGYNLAVKHADRNYDEFSADFREAQARLREEYEEDLAEAERRASSIEAQAEETLASAKSQAYDEGRAIGFSEGYRMGGAEAADERAEEAFEQGRITGLEKGRREALSDEALANARSQAYEAGYARGQEEAHKVGYQRGLAEGQARGSDKALSDARTLELMAEARESERQKIEASQPKLSVWFMPCGKNKFEMQNGAPVLIHRGYTPNKIEGVRAIRAAYDLGLKEAKDLVETDADGLIPCGEALPQSKAVELYLRLYDLGYQVELRKP